MPQPDFSQPERTPIKIKGLAHLKELEKRGQPRFKRFIPHSETEKMVSNTKFKLSPEEKRAAAEYMEGLLEQKEEENKDASTGNN